MEDKIRKHLYLSGRVQGVGFRASARRKAGEIGVKGWIRNLFDGRVEAVIEGKKEKVKRMVNYLKNGPSFARVEDIEIHDEKYKDEFNKFTVKY
ncbi:MAG: acylphosphatase [Bacillota bacterium]